MLTPRQQQVLSYIQQCIHDRGYPPTVREIGKYMGIRSTNGVNDHLKALERKGYLQREDMKSRALRPVEDQEKVLEIPIIGQVAAGRPLLAVEELEGTVSMDRALLGTVQQVFTLKVTGHSMIEDGIFDGDFLFIKKQPTAHAGDIVIAMIDDTATVKRYYPETNAIRLQPANSTMEPLYISEEEAERFSIIGIVIGIYRRLRATT